MEAKNRRAWIKNVAIIFLTVLLLLTFFSNTILNYSLPEVSAQYARYDSISGAIKANGTVKANESYVVTYDEADSDSEVTTPGQTRKVVSVYVKQGSEVAIGDPILALEGGSSEELKTAEENLKTAEKELRELEKEFALAQLTDTINDLTSDKSKNESLNTLAKSKAELAELQELYTALLAGTDPTETLKTQKKAAEKEADSVQKQIDAIKAKISETEGKISAAEGNIKEDYTTTKTLQERYNEAKQEYDSLKVDYDKLTAQVETLEDQYEVASGLSGDVAKAYEISKEIQTLTESLKETQQKLQYLIEDNNNVLFGGGTSDSEDSSAIQEAEAKVDKAKKEYDAYYAENQLYIEAQKDKKNILEEALADAKEIYEHHKKFESADLNELNRNVHKAEQALAEAEFPNLDKANELEAAWQEAKATLEALKKGNASSGDTITGTTGSSAANDPTSVTRQIKEYQEQIAKLQNQIAEAHAKLDILGVSYIDNLTDYAVDTNTTKLKEELDKAQKELTALTTDYEAAKSEYESLAKQMNSTTVITENEAMLAVFEADLETYEEKLEEINEKIADLGEQITDNASSKKPEEVKEEIDTLTSSIQTLELQMKIDDATDKKSDAESVYSREDDEKAIADKKADIEELQNKIKAMQEAPDQTIVTAPIAGKIVEVNFVPGNKVTSGNEVARIEVADKGYICEISMSTEEARKIQVGATCSVTNSWWYSDLTATVSQIRSDPQSQGKNRIVVIEVKGDVYEGQSLSFSIGDKSQSYDSVLPNSAIREDSEGKFVLVVESKNTPLSVRYTARRMSIEVITSDDTKSAVSGLYGSEFVITSATSPISDGQQVRLAEN